MSAVFGILRRDGAPVAPSAPKTMRRALADWGPDAITEEEETMDNEKSKGASITAGARETGDSGSRRIWSKPIVTRIDIKRTMVGTGSLNDGVINASSTG